MSSPFISAAMKVAETYSVFPTTGKAPAWSNKELGVERGKGGYHTATKAKTVIKDRFMRGTCIGVPCRPNGIVVVDVDLYKGEHVVKWHEENYHLLKDTLCHRSGNGGLHYIFRDPGGKLPGTVARDVDLKCNGYINWAGAGGYEAVNDLPIQPYPVFDAKPNGKGPSGVYSDGLSNDELVQQVIKAESFHPALRTLSARLASYSHCTADEIEEKLTALMDESEAKSIQHPDHDRWVDRRSKIPDLAQSAVAKFDPIPPGVEVIDATHMLGNGVDHDPPEYEEAEAVEVAPTAPSMPPGMVGRVAAYSSAEGRRQQPLFDIAAGLMVLATVNANRAVVSYDGWETGLNLYIMLVAPTGSGKEHPRTILQDMVERLGDLAPADFWSEVASHPALLRGLQEGSRHSAVLAMDEIGKYLKVAGNANQSHQFMLISVIIQLYGLALKTMPARRYANNKDNIKAIDRPYLNVLGTTTAEALVPALRSEDVVNGMLNRFLIMKADYAPRSPQRGQHDLKLLLADFGLLLQTLGKKVITVTKPAEKLLRAWEDEIEQHMVSGEPLWQRTFENTLKIAGVVALGDGGKIKPEHVSWAVGFVRWCQHHMEHTVAGQIISETEHELQDKVIAYLKKNGAKAKPQIHRRFSREPKKLFDEVFAKLCDMQVIVSKKDGRKTLYHTI